jgi:hypothetical protein
LLIHGTRDVTDPDWGDSPGIYRHGIHLPEEKDL